MTREQAKARDKDDFVHDRSAMLLIQTLISMALKEQGLDSIVSQEKAMEQGDE